MEAQETIKKALIDSILLTCGGCCLHNDDTMTKVVDRKLIRKQSVGKKDWSHDWIENVEIEDIDTRYFYLDYSRKTKPVT